MQFDLLGAAAIGVFGFWFMLRWEAKRGNAAGCALSLWDAGLMSGMSGLVIGRLVAMMSAGINPLADPFQIILVRSGVSTVGATLGTLVVFVWIARKALLDAADGIAPAALVGLAGWHAGCVATGSCLGVESSLPWATGLPGSAVTRHPVELYAAGALLVAGVGLALWKQHGRPLPGSVAGVALLAASLIRLATEPLRISLTGGPIYLYIVGALAGTTLLTWSLITKP
ncbi:MAG: prolipoprotein diacylglyceryl transferase family protein [Actinomycetota bacterium]